MLLLSFFIDIIYQSLIINFNRAFFDIWLDPYTLHILTFTLFQAFLSSIISTVIGMILAKSMFMQEFIGKHLLLKIFSITFVLPALAIIVGIISVFGKNGLINMLFNLFNYPINLSVYGLTGILITHTFFNMPFACKLFYKTLENIPNSQRKLANQLNMKGFKLFTIVEWFYLKPQLISTFCLIFMLCFTSFTIVLTLGGGPKYTTLEVAIYQAIMFEFNLSKASTLAILQCLCCISAFSFTQILEVRQNSYYLLNNTIWKAKNSIFSSYFNGIFIAISVIFILTPLFNIIYQTLISKDLLSSLFNIELQKATLYSILLASISAVISVMIAIILIFFIRELEYKNFVMPAKLILSLSYIILAIPTVVMAFGVFLTLQNIAINNLITFFIIVLCNSIISLPFVMNILYIPFKNIYFRYFKLNTSLNIKGFKKFKLIEWAYLKTHIKYSLAFSMAISLGDFAIIAFFGNQQFSSLPLLLYRQINSYNFGQASVTAFILLLLSAILFIVAERKNDFIK